MVRLHPEEYIFYNQLVGGVAGAEGRFELDYWGTSIAEATAMLEAKLKAENGGRLGGRYKVFVCANPTSALYFLPPNFVLTDDRREADFFVALTLSGCDKTLDGKSSPKSAALAPPWRWSRIAGISSAGRLPELPSRLTDMKLSNDRRETVQAEGGQLKP